MAPPILFDRGIAISAKHGPTYQGMLITEPEARAAAANYYTWGATGVAYWNVGIHFGSRPTAADEQRERIRGWTSAVHDPALVFEGPRLYHFLPMGKGMRQRKPPVRNYPWADEGSSPLGQPNSPVLTFAADKVGERQVFPFRMADGRDGEQLKGTLQFRVYHLSRDDKLDIDINGIEVKPEDIGRLEVEPRTELTGTRYVIELADCPPFRGKNALGLTLQSAPKAAIAPYMEELEVLVK